MPKFTSIPAALQSAGQYSLGSNLYLVVGESGSASWVLRYRANGPVVKLGLGSATGLGKHKVSKEAARRQANKLLTMFAEGEDPRADRRRMKAGDTFQQLLDGLLKSKIPTKSHDQWKASLRDHASALLKMRVAAITVDDVLATLRPIWGSETAARVQDRVEKVLQAAVAQGLLKSNVAAWKGHLDSILSAKPSKKVAAGDNHKALPYADLPAFIQRLLGYEGAGAQALLFCVLTATRSGETLGALKSEIDREARTWTIPAKRMKAGVEHIVPLSDQAMAIVNARWELPGDFLFANKTGGQLGATALNDKLVKPAMKGGMGLFGVATVHGFRSAFSDFIGNETSVDVETREHCLAHQLDAVKGAYRRQSAVEKRRAAMQVWANYAFGISAKVVLQLHAA